MKLKMSSTTVIVAALIVAVLVLFLVPSVRRYWSEGFTSIRSTENVGRELAQDLYRSLWTSLRNVIEQELPKMTTRQQYLMAKVRGRMQTSSVGVYANQGAPTGNDYTIGAKNIDFIWYLVDGKAQNSGRNTGNLVDKAYASRVVIHTAATIAGAANIPGPIDQSKNVGMRPADYAEAKQYLTDLATSKLGWNWDLTKKHALW